MNDYNNTFRRGAITRHHSVDDFIGFTRICRNRLALLGDAGVYVVRGLLNGKLVTAEVSAFHAEMFTYRVWGGRFDTAEFESVEDARSEYQSRTREAARMSRPTFIRLLECRGGSIVRPVAEFVRKGVKS